jgi:Uma2 family endonuclease
MATLQISQIELAPGQSLRLGNVNWAQFKDILADLGEHRAARIAYDNGILEIMVPLTDQEDSKEIIGDLIKAVLEELNTEFRALGSTTFERQSTLKAIEPDQCFYIQNEATIRGKRRIDLSVDPPPDLALVIDLAARIQVKTYEALAVPELWHFSRQGLSIYVLKAGKYEAAEESSISLKLPLQEVIPYCLEQSRTLGRNTVIRDFRAWVRDMLKK